MRPPRPVLTAASRPTREARPARFLDPRRPARPHNLRARHLHHADNGVGLHEAIASRPPVVSGGLHRGASRRPTGCRRPARAASGTSRSPTTTTSSTRPTRRCSRGRRRTRTSCRFRHTRTPSPVTSRCSAHGPATATTARPSRSSSATRPRRTSRRAACRSWPTRCARTAASSRSTTPAT